MVTYIQASGKVITDVCQIGELLIIITPLTHNAEAVRSAFIGAGGAFNEKINLMGALGVEIGMGESFNEMTDPAAAIAERVNATITTPFSVSIREDQVLLAKIVQLIIHDNTDIAYQILVVSRKQLCKGTIKPLFYAITCLIIFSSSLSHHATSLPRTPFWVFNFNHLS